MKIITEENGKKRVYIQRLDLAILPALIEDGSPATVYWYGVDSLQNITNKNRFDFILVKDTKIASFIEHAKYILDFSDFKDYSIRELKEKIRMIEESMETTRDYIIAETEEEKKSKINFLNQKKYMKLMLLNFIDYKKNKITLFIPASYRSINSKQKKLMQR